MLQSCNLCVSIAQLRGNLLGSEQRPLCGNQVLGATGNNVAATCSQDGRSSLILGDWIQGIVNLLRSGRQRFRGSCNRGCFGAASYPDTTYQVTTHPEKLENKNDIRRSAYGQPKGVSPRPGTKGAVYRHHIQCRIANGLARWQRIFDSVRHGHRSIKNLSRWLLTFQASAP
jgi:hypothetical protein